MKTNNPFTSLAPAMPMQRLAPPCLSFKFNAPDVAPLHRWTPPARFIPQQNTASTFARELAGDPLIYAVDDEPHLTELYTIILEATGCRVMAFNDRVEALRSLRRENRKPDLLVVDYIGNSMLADQFMNLCLAVCPRLRILMASGLSQNDMSFFSVRPDRFLQKPFTPEEFLKEVEAALIIRPERSA